MITRHRSSNQLRRVLGVLMLCDLAFMLVAIKFLSLVLAVPIVIGVAIKLVFLIRWFSWAPDQRLHIDEHIVSWSSPFATPREQAIRLADIASIARVVNPRTYDEPEIELLLRDGRRCRLPSVSGSIEPVWDALVALLPRIPHEEREESPKEVWRALKRILTWKPDAGAKRRLGP